jgi:hypothetical protein
VVALAIGLALGLVFYAWWSRQATSGRLQSAPRIARIAFPFAIGLVVVSIAFESVHSVFFVVPLLAMAIAGFDIAFLGGVMRARRVENRRDGRDQ